MKSIGTVVSFVVAGIIAVSAASCGVRSADEPELGVAESALSATVTQPVQGDCTTTKSLNRMTVSGNDVIRGECTITCNKHAFQMGIWNVGVVKPDGSEPMADNLGSGPTRAAHVDVPYAPGFYSVTCTSMWQEKSGSTHFFSSGGPFVGDNF